MPNSSCTLVVSDQDGTLQMSKCWGGDSYCIGWRKTIVIARYGLIAIERLVYREEESNMAIPRQSGGVS